MPSLISHLNQAEQRELFENINYLNMQELKRFWTKGKAPTYKEFAKLWLMAAEAHTQPNRE